MEIQRCINPKYFPFTDRKTPGRRIRPALKHRVSLCGLESFPPLACGRSNPPLWADKLGVSWVLHVMMGQQASLGTECWEEVVAPMLCIINSARAEGRENTSGHKIYKKYLIMIGRNTRMNSIQWFHKHFRKQHDYHAVDDTWSILHITFHYVSSGDVFFFFISQYGSIMPWYCMTSSSPGRRSQGRAGEKGNNQYIRCSHSR